MIGFNSSTFIPNTSEVILLTESRIQICRTHLLFLNAMHHLFRQSKLAALDTLSQLGSTAPDQLCLQDFENVPDSNNPCRTRYHHESSNCHTSTGICENMAMHVTNIMMNKDEV